MHVNGVMSASLKKAGIWSNIGQHREDTEVYDVCQSVWRRQVYGVTLVSMEKTLRSMMYVSQFGICRSNIGQHMEKTLRSMIKFTIALLCSNHNFSAILKHLACTGRHA